MPRLLLNYNGYVFKLDLQGQVLNYIPALKNPKRITYVGYRAIKGYNQLAFLRNGDIEFKSAGTVYQLYIYFVFFLGLFVFLTYFLRKNIYDTSQFARNIFKWIFFKDRGARIEVLKSELEE